MSGNLALVLIQERVVRGISQKTNGHCTTLKFID